MNFIRIFFSFILVCGLIFQSRPPFSSPPKTLAPKGKAWEISQDPSISKTLEEMHDTLNKKATFVLFVVDEILTNKKIKNNFSKELTKEMKAFKESIPHFNNGNRLPLSQKYRSFPLAEKILIHFKKDDSPSNKELISLDLIEELPRWKEELQNQALQHKLKINGEFHQFFFWLDFPADVEQAL